MCETLRASQRKDVHARVLPIVLLLACASGARAQQPYTRVSRELDAGSALGRASGHARAISCTNGGYFQQLRGYVTEDRVAGFELCCGGDNSAIWYEGISPNSGQECAWIGVEDDSPKDFEDCADGSAISGISFAAIANPTDRATEQWAQFCNAEACGVVDLSVTCWDLTSGTASKELEGSGSTLACAQGEVVTAMYVSWDAFGVHNIAGVQCRRVYTAVDADAAGIVAEDTSQCPGAPANSLQADLSCQGYAGDLCGCLNLPAYSKTPFYGCALAGFSGDDALPVATLPYVQTPQANAAQCTDVERALSAAEPWIWKQVRDTTQEPNTCLTAVSASEPATLEACQPSDDIRGGPALQQQWRVVEFADAEYDALESLSEPGMCVTLQADGSPGAPCACANLALAANGRGDSELPPAPPPPEVTPVPPPEAPPAVLPAVAPEAATFPQPIPAPFDSAEAPAVVLNQDGSFSATQPEFPAEPDPYGELGGEYPEAGEDGEDDGDDGDDEGDRERRDRNERRRLLVQPMEQASRAGRRLWQVAGECPAAEGLLSWQSSGGRWSLEDVRPKPSSLLLEAQKLVRAVQSAGGASFAIRALGAPGDASAYPQSLTSDSEFDPLRVCDWRRVLCGGQGVLQLLLEGYDTVENEGIEADFFRLSGLKGFGVLGTGKGAGPPPKIDAKSTLVALHIQGTALDGTAPCEWVQSGSLQSLGLRGNVNLRGPLPLCYVAMDSADQNVYIENNSAASPFCGSGQADAHPIAAALPKCSDVPNIVTTNVPISLQLRNGGDCAAHAATMQTFLRNKLAFAFDTTAVTCPAAAAGRRLLQDARAFDMQAQTAGPGAAGVIDEALVQGSPVFADLTRAFQSGGLAGADAQNTDPPPPPPAPTPPGSQGSQAPPNVGPGSRAGGDGGGGGGDDETLSTAAIIGIAVGAALLALIAVGLFIKCRADRRAAKEDAKYLAHPGAAGGHADGGSDFQGTDGTSELSGLAGAAGRAELASPNSSGKVVPPNINPPVALKAKSATRSTGAHTTFPARSGSGARGAAGASSGGTFADPRLNPVWGTGGGTVSAFAGDSSQGSDSLFAPNQPGGSFAPPTPPSESPGQNPGVVTGRSGSSASSDITGALSDSSVVSRSLSKVKTTGNARRTSGSNPPPQLPSASNNYPHSEELAKMSSREIHRRMRSPEVSGSRKGSSVRKGSAAGAGPASQSTAAASEASSVPAGSATAAVPDAPAAAEAKAPAGEAAKAGAVGASAAAAAAAAGAALGVGAVAGGGSARRRSSGTPQAPAESPPPAPTAAQASAAAAAEPSFVSPRAADDSFVDAAEPETDAESSTVAVAPTEAESRPEGGYVAAAMAAAAAAPAAETFVQPQPALETREISLMPASAAPDEAAAAAASPQGPVPSVTPPLSPRSPGGAMPTPPLSGPLPSPPLSTSATQQQGVIEEKNGMILQYVMNKRVAAPVSGSLSPSHALSRNDHPTGELSGVLGSMTGATRGAMAGESVTAGLTGMTSAADMAMGMTAADAAMATGGAEDGSGALSDKSQAMSVSSFTSISVMSESTTVYTNIGGKHDADDVTKLEQLLNRVQRDLGGQVGSFRLKGPRHRFTGRSSVVAFADGMWGGDFALKFYADLEAAQTEFAIYRQAPNMQMALPPVQELEDNTGGVLRLKDGTPLPPYLAMPRGLPLTEWYALHRPRQAATLTMLAQVLFRLEKLHKSGYCHNDVKPANIVLLDAAVGRQPAWHIVDFTNICQIGSQARARYTLEYASPEVIRAVGAMRAHYVECKPSMDIWSLGVIIFEVLTGKAFFPLECNRDAMKDGLVGLEPLPVEEDPKVFQRVPAEGDLRATVKAMLSRDTARRPTAAEVRESVKECLKALTGEVPEDPVDAHPHSPLSSLGRPDSHAGRPDSHNPSSSIA